MNTEQLIRSLDDVDFVAQRAKRVLTLFSGGLDSTYLLKVLAENPTCEVIALTVDVGDQVDRADLAAIAAHFGARSMVVDEREAFAKDAVLPALRSNAFYLTMYPISSSLSRPIICRAAVDIARKLDCDAIIHTANQSQNSLRRLNGAISQLGFSKFYGSPYEFSVLSREEKMEHLRDDFPGRYQSREVSGDANLWCREFESGVLENPESFHIPSHLLYWTIVRPDGNVSDHVSIRFEKGTPVALDDTQMPLVEIIHRLNIQVGSFGIGRYAGLEHLDEGEKVLEVREAPAAYLLTNAYRHLEMAILDAELLREKISIEQIWVREAIEGRWYGALRTSVEQFITETACNITGTVDYRLRAGAADVCSIRADKPRYLTHRDIWEKETARIRSARGLRALHGVQGQEKTGESSHRTCVTGSSWTPSPTSHSSGAIGQASVL